VTVKCFEMKYVLLFGMTLTIMIYKMWEFSVLYHEGSWTFGQDIESHNCVLSLLPVRD
jgi:hypothetical protein